MLTLENLANMGAMTRLEQGGRYAFSQNYKLDFYNTMCICVPPLLMLSIYHFPCEYVFLLKTLVNKRDAFLLSPFSVLKF